MLDVPLHLQEGSIYFNEGGKNTPLSKSVLSIKKTKFHSGKEMQGMN